MNLHEYMESYLRWQQNYLNFCNTFWSMYLQRVNERIKEMTNG
jgi:hypothetical protein